MTIFKGVIQRFNQISGSPLAYLYPQFLWLPMIMVTYDYDYDYDFFFIMIVVIPDIPISPGGASLEFHRSKIS